MKLLCLWVVLDRNTFTDLVEQERGVKLRGDESFGELMEKLGPAGSKEEGIGSLFPKDKDGFDEGEVAEFVKK